MLWEDSKATTKAALSGGKQRWFPWQGRGPLHPWHCRHELVTPQERPPNGLSAADGHNRPGTATHLWSYTWKPNDRASAALLSKIIDWGVFSCALSKWRTASRWRCVYSLSWESSWKLGHSHVICYIFPLLVLYKNDTMKSPVVSKQPFVFMWDI